MSTASPTTRELVSQMQPDPSASSKDADPPESIVRASFTEIFGALTLATPTWTILRHPFRFTRYRANPGAAIHYFYSAVALALLAIALTDADADNDGGDAAPVATLINNAIGALGLHAKLEGRDALPVMLLCGNIIGGLTAYLVCRWLAGRHHTVGFAAIEGVGSQTLAATAYLGGAGSVVFAIGLLLARGDTDALPAEAAGLLLIFLIYCWGVWLRQIYGILPGKVAGFLFPYGLSLLSLAVFAGLLAAINFVLTGNFGS